MGLEARPARKPLGDIADFVSSIPPEHRATFAALRKVMKAAVAASSR